MSTSEVHILYWGLIALGIFLAYLYHYFCYERIVHQTLDEEQGTERILSSPSMSDTNIVATSELQLHECSNN